MDALGTELCNFCDEVPAVLFCHDCNMHFCIANGCDDQIHSGKRHKKEAITGSTTTAVLDEEAPRCEFCELSASEAYCEDCCMYFCTANGCLASVHKNAIGHEITSLIIDDGVSEYDEEQEGPSDLRSQSRNSDSVSLYGATADDLDLELSQLSLSRGAERSIDTNHKPDRETRALPSQMPASIVSKGASSDLPQSLTKGSPAKAARGSAPPATKSATSATKLVSNVMKRFVAPIKGTGTKEEREKRKEAVLAARKEPLPKLPLSTFGTKFAPDDAKGRRKPSLSFLKQPGTRTTSSSSPSVPSSLVRPPPSAPRTPSPAPPADVKRGASGGIVITSVTTIRTTTTIRADAAPKPKSQTPAAVTRTRSLSNSSVASQSSVRGSDQPSSVMRSISDKHASPAASLPSSLFSPSSVLPSPTVSSARQTPVRRASIVSNPPLPSPTSRLVSASSSASSVSGRRGSVLSQSASLSTYSSNSSTSSVISNSETDFKYPAGLAPLGLKYVNAPDAGILVRAVVSGEAGDKAGLQVGDTVKLLNRKAVRNMGEFQSIISECKSGVVYKMAVVRKDKSVDLKLVL